MISAKIMVAVVLGAFGLGMVPSCASTSRTEGTDSNTHWLEQCRTDKDCGSLQCRCGACTKPCSVPSDCTSFGTTAACATSACGVEPKTCVAACTTNADCPHGGTGFECRGGQCGAVTVAVDGGQDSGVCPNSVQPDGPCSGTETCNGECAGGFQSYYTCSAGHWERGFLQLACGPDAGNVPVDGGACPASAASGAACDARIGTCFTQCLNGTNGRFTCSAGQWVAGHGLFPCGTCPDGIQGGDACSSADSQCFTPCVNGFHGQYVCSDGLWVAGKGLFTCETEAGSSSCCVSPKITWRSIGMVYSYSYELDCGTYRRTPQPFQPGSPCTAMLPSCDSPGITPLEVERAAGDADVVAVPSSGTTLYGIDRIATSDGNIDEISVAGKIIDVGAPCDGTAGCVPIPPGVAALLDLLHRVTLQEQDACVSGGPRDAGKDPCAPMDAHTGNLPCIGIVGYAWTGTDCAEIECSCDGADCGAIYQTTAACRSARAECLVR